MIVCQPQAVSSVLGACASWRTYSIMNWPLTLQRASIWTSASNGFFTERVSLFRFLSAILLRGSKMRGCENALLYHVNETAYL